MLSSGLSKRRVWDTALEWMAFQEVLKVHHLGAEGRNSHEASRPQEGDNTPQQELPLPGFGVLSGTPQVQLQSPYQTHHMKPKTLRAP